MNELRETIKNLREERDGLIEKLKDYEQHEETYIKEYNEKLDKCNTIRKQLSECDDDKQSINDNFENLHQRFKENIIKLGDCEQNLRRNKIEINVFNEIKQELDELNETYKELTSNYKLALKKNEKLTDQLNSLSSKYFQKERILEAEIKQLKSQHPIQVASNNIDGNLQSQLIAAIVSRDNTLKDNIKAREELDTLRLRLNIAAQQQAATQQQVADLIQQLQISKQ